MRPLGFPVASPPWHGGMGSRGSATPDGMRGGARRDRSASSPSRAGAARSDARGLEVWASFTAARLDLDAVQEHAARLRRGSALRPGVAIQAVSESLDRLRYREVTTAPASPASSAGPVSDGRSISASREDVARGAVRVQLAVRGPRIAE